jgi:Protein of unknown function (DUF2917)
MITLFRSEPSPRPVKNGRSARSSSESATASDHDGHRLRSNAPVCLRKGEVIGDEYAQGGDIACRRGKLWITQTGLDQDVILVNGQSFHPRPAGRLVIEALETSCIVRGTPTVLGRSSPDCRIRHSTNRPSHTTAI